MITWTERTYHRRRRQLGLGRLTPRVRDTAPHRRSAGIRPITPTESPEWGQTHVPRHLFTVSRDITVDRQVTRHSFVKSLDEIQQWFEAVQNARS